MYTPNSHERLSRVFEPLNVQGLVIPNRIALAPINTGFATLEGMVTQRLVDFHQKIAGGKVGLSIVGSTAVSSEGLVNFNGLRLYDDKFASGISALFEAIEKEGSVPAIQLMHSGRQTTRQVTGMAPVAPTMLESANGEALEELSREGIKRIVSDFATASRRAKEAGAKLIEVHAAHGYLITQFLSAYSNNRTDEYGGSLQNRSRFLEEVILAIRREVNLPLSVRLSVIEFVPGGLELVESCRIAKRLEQLGVAMISVSAGNYVYSSERIYPTTEREMFERAQWSAAVKSGLTIPVIGGGRVADLLDAERFLTEGKMDMVAMGRPLIADPNLVAKTKRGEWSAIEFCNWTNYCRYPSPVVNSCLRCEVNRNL